ncbi:MAG: ATP-grasp domain-containing protein [Acidobacteria bacterium]|nr:ATP-grasp domain-containing protein [Acidobacteriota bacterium]MCB9397372.1 ATP-grasp domain-containing protein [Acidobacteriota bacterium]
MNVLFFSPGFPAEMPYFARGLKTQGARVFGIGDQPVESLPDVAREALDHYIPVRLMWQEEAVLAAIEPIHQRYPFQRILCLWEPGMLLAARLRERLGVPGLNHAQTVPFRDKEVMKKVLAEAGIRVPRNQRAASVDAIWQASRDIGFPLVVKPIAGAGSADTYRVDSADHLAEIIPKLNHVPEVSVEEFIDGKEYTYDTICANGRILYDNVAWYRPNPIIGRSEEWISPQTLTLRDMDQPHIQAGIQLGQAVLKALNYQTGFTHMEWFYSTSGEAVFGEIGARPPGGRSVELMNYGCDIDVFSGWAEAEIKGSFSQKIERKYNAAVVFKRAQGQGRIVDIRGLDDIRREMGSHIVCENLLPLGAPRRNWKQTLISDGYLIVRHPDLQRCMDMADRIGSHLQLYAR